jgi:hypothetical protein
VKGGIISTIIYLVMLRCDFPSSMTFHSMEKKALVNGATMSTGVYLMSRILSITTEQSDPGPNL